MTIINMRDLDAQMGRTIDPNSVPKHDGASQVSMEANFVAQSDTRVIDQGAGRFGASIMEGHEVSERGYFGSKKVISLNEAPPLETKHEPKDDPNVKALEAAARAALAPKVAPVLVPVLAPRPMVQGARDINQLMASLRRKV